MSENLFAKHFFPRAISRLGIALVVLAGALGLQPGRPAQAATDTWSTTGSLTTTRRDHTATLLPDGRVLVAGGLYQEGMNTYYLTSAETYDPASGVFTTTGALTTDPRAYHTATLLPDGQVLVAGGAWYDGSTHYLTSAELYDPASGVFTTTGALTTDPRAYHTATLLPDGRVLAVGGTNDYGFTDSVELYDPATGAFTTTGGLTTDRRAYHTATLLPDGRVLAVGGNGSSGYLTTTEVYSPTTGAWSASGSLTTTRRNHTATLLPDGRVLVVGGSWYDGSTHYLASAELYDPATGVFSATASLNTARRNHTATLLPDGRVLVAGGQGTDGSALNGTEVYDPDTETWSNVDDLTVGRGSHTATLLSDGQVLVAGGSTASAELYDPAAPAWSTSGSLVTSRYDHTATLLPDGRVLAVGGKNGASSYHTSAETYDPATGVFTTTGGLTTDPRASHTATLLPDGQVLVAGGAWYDGSNHFLASAETYDPASGLFTTTGSLNTARRHHTATLLPDGRVLVAGGANDYGPTDSVELYDPATGAFTTTGILDTARNDHTATLLPDGRVLVVCGAASLGYLTTTEVYSPTTGAWSASGGLTTDRRAYHSATLLPDGRVLVAGGSWYDGSTHYLASAELYDPATGVFSATAGLNTARRNHTATLLPDGRVLVTGGTGVGDLALSSAEVYDPDTETWSNVDSLADNRTRHTATLLGDGQVLVVGGGGTTGPLTSAELYDRGLGFDPAWRPLLDSATNPLFVGRQLLAAGSGFRGHWEGSGGATNNSATNYPLVQLRRVDNEQMRWLLPDPAAPFSDTAFTSTPLGDFPQGHALVTVFTNGIPSASGVVLVDHLTYIYLPLVLRNF